MKFASLIVAAALIAGVPALSGCDDTIESRESKEVKSDGTVVKEKESVKQEADGTVVKEEKKTVDK